MQRCSRTRPSRFEPAGKISVFPIWLQSRPVIGQTIPFRIADGLDWPAASRCRVATTPC